MRVFVTGATGFIGSAIVKELTGAGYKVLGLARSEKSVQALKDAGVEVLTGDLNDPESLKKGAAETDAVIHTAFIHDFANFEASAAADKAAIEAMGSVLAGTNRPMIVTGGTLGIQFNGPWVTEDDAAPAHPRASEAAGLELAKQGIRSSVVRLPPSVHDKGDKGFVPMLISVAREKGFSAYIGDGSNRWPAVHRLDAAHLYRLVLEKGKAGTRYNGTGDEGIPTRQIAEVIGKQLNLPVKSVSQEDAAAHFTWIARFFALNAPSSSKKTKAELGWQPAHPGLIEDLEMGHYFGK